MHHKYITNWHGMALCGKLKYLVNLKCNFPSKYCFSVINLSDCTGMSNYIRILPLQTSSWSLWTWPDFLLLLQNCTETASHVSKMIHLVFKFIKLVLWPPTNYSIPYCMKRLLFNFTLWVLKLYVWFILYGDFTTVCFNKVTHSSCLPKKQIFTNQTTVDPC